MAVLVWIVEGTWPACVDAVKAVARAGTDVVLLHVTTEEVPGIAHGAYSGLLGRGHPERDPGRQVEDLAETSAGRLLTAAAQRLQRPSTRLHRHGRPEREVIAAAENAELLVLARDSGRPGPKSLGRAGRFVVDHAPCPVLLVWPPTTDSNPIPPTPPHRPGGR